MPKELQRNALADQSRKGRGVQILSISCNFSENLAKSYVCAPGGLVLPPPGNPGSATGINSVDQLETAGKLRVKLTKFTN